MVELAFQPRIYGLKYSVLKQRPHEEKAETEKTRRKKGYYNIPRKGTKVR